MANSSERADRLSLRKHLLDLLGGGNAHLDFDTALDGLAPAHRGQAVTGSPHTIWQLVEHLRIAQYDILDFSRNAEYKALKWPDDYWPMSAGPADDEAWTASVTEFHGDRKAFEELIGDPNQDLFAPISHAPDGQTLLREALVLADHNSYHLGQIVTMRKMLEGGASK